MFEKYMEEQNLVTTVLKKSLKNDKLVQAYLFSSDDIDYIYKYAKDFSKDIIGLSGLPSETLENIYKRIDKDEYTELKVVEPDGNTIKKSQLIELQNSVSTKPVEANKIIYIIKNYKWNLIKSIKTMDFLLFFWYNVATKIFGRMSNDF